MLIQALTSPRSGGGGALHTGNDVIAHRARRCSLRCRLSPPHRCRRWPARCRKHRHLLHSPFLMMRTSPHLASLGSVALEAWSFSSTGFAQDGWAIKPSADQGARWLAALKSHVSRFDVSKRFEALMSEKIENFLPYHSIYICKANASLSVLCAAYTFTDQMLHGGRHSPSGQRK